jgi:cytochrome c oxidase subunit I+III
VAGWANMNLLSSVGGVILTLGVLLFIINAIRSRTHGEAAGANPWNADTLEWSASSPPPNYNFPRIPMVAGRNALWQQTADQPVITGLRSDIRETLVTHVLDAELDHRMRLPKPSIWPFITAVATTAFFIGSIFTPWAVPIGAIPVFVAMVGWFWPTKKDHEEQLSAEEQNKNNENKNGENKNNETENSETEAQS